MKTRKAIFVTILVATMLAVIDICLYVICSPAFAVLTGTVVIYGVLRGTVDFYGWLCKPDTPGKPKPAAKKPTPAPATENGGFYDWETEEEPKKVVPDDKKAAAVMRVLDEDL